MKKILVLMMLVVSMGAFAERGDKGDHDIRLDIYREMRMENVDRMSRENEQKELDLNVQEIIKQKIEYNMFDRGQGER